MRTIEELHILVGLPGSGKTTFANSFKDKGYVPYGAEKYKYADIVDFDAIIEKIVSKVGSRSGLDIKKEEYEKYAFRPFNFSKLILDGLFITQEDIEYVLDIYLGSEYFCKHFKVEKIIVDYWKPNIEACIWNDKGRRELTSEITIRNMKLVKPNVKSIEKRFSVPSILVTHEVVRKPNYVLFAHENNIVNLKEGKYLYSSSWCLGGTGFGWSGDRSYDIAAESPCEFIEFDNLLEQICPQITFLQYKRLYSYCVTQESKDDSDYYSRTSSGYFVCDMEKLYEKLLEMNLIDSIN